MSLSRTQHRLASKINQRRHEHEERNHWISEQWKAAEARTAWNPHAGLFFNLENYRQVLYKLWPTLEPRKVKRSAKHQPYR